MGAVSGQEFLEDLFQVIIERTRFRGQEGSQIKPKDKALRAVSLVSAVQGGVCFPARDNCLGIGFNLILRGEGKQQFLLQFLVRGCVKGYPAADGQPIQASPEFQASEQGRLGVCRQGTDHIQDKPANRPVSGMIVKRIMGVDR